LYPRVFWETIIIGKKNNFVTKERKIKKETRLIKKS